MTMTAAQHFEQAEELLEKAATNNSHDKVIEWASRAQAHLMAARLLFDIQVSSVHPNSSPGTAAYRAGLDVIADKRAAS